MTACYIINDDGEGESVNIKDKHPVNASLLCLEVFYFYALHVEIEKKT